MLQSVVVPESRLEQALDRAADYIASRQCRNGGFCYYRSDDLEEPNLHDTYYAVAACKLLTREIPNRDRVVDYLRSMRTAGRQSSYLYYYAFTTQRLGEPELLDQAFLDRVAELRINLPHAGKNVPLSDWLEDSLWIIRLKKTFTNHSAMDEIKNFVRDLIRSGGVGVKPNLVDTYLALSILAELNGLAGLDKAKAFVNRLQLPSFGFRYTEDSLSGPSIDIVYSGVFSCALLGLGVQYVPDIMSAVLLSQRLHGGFARSPDSLGNLDTHCKALRIIQQVGSA